MKCEKIYLGEEKNAELRTYISHNCPELALPPRPAMLILPGGGYVSCSERETEPVARAFLNFGFNTFVLIYSCREKAKFPRPLKDAAEAMVYIKRHAEEFNIDPERVYVLGFSAGGHLAASLGTLWNTEDAYIEGMKPGENKPRGMVLCYPVIALTGKYMNQTTSDNVMGRHVDIEDEETEKYCLHNRVTKDTVPAFIWNTRDDDAVPTMHSARFITALTENDIPYEYHCFAHGTHGLSIATWETASGHDYMTSERVAIWPTLVNEWIKEGEAKGDFK